MSLDTLDSATIALLAQAAQTGGGRHAFRAKNDDVRDAAKALADASRKERRSAARKQRQMDRAADAAIMRAFNGYDAALLCENARHKDACCAYGQMIDAWALAPAYKDVRRMARHLLTADEIDRSILPEDWRRIVRQWRDTRAVTAALGGFSLSRDDMRADSRSRFFKRAAYILSLQDHVNVAASPEDIFQDAIVSSLENGDGVAFGTMFRHVKSSAVSAAWRYQRMGNRATGNVRDWTWQDWTAWASANDGSDRLAYSTDTEWQAFDAARLAHEANEAHRRSVAERRAADTAELDATRQAWATLIGQGLTVGKICRMLGRSPETVLSELADTGRPVRHV